MLCQNCKKNEATTHIKSVINGEATQSHLCSVCAQSLGMNSFFDDFNFNLPSLFSGFFDDAIFALGEGRGERCEKCGSTFDEIIKSGKVGCADCYEKFYQKLAPSLQRIHGKVNHTGKKAKKLAEEIKPSEPSVEDKISSLEKEMEKAIGEQNFERAAVLRDEIKKLKEEK